jgi:uncharacterized LabA/DUF88 family protein
VRESGRIVYGFGERKTPEPFRTACDKFIYTEVLAGSAANEAEAAPTQRSAKELRSDTHLLSLLRNAIEAASDDTGWAGLGAIGSIINKQSPDFDSRNYGYAKLSGLVNGIGLFETEERHIGNGKHIYVRPRTSKK